LKPKEEIVDSDKLAEDLMNGDLESSLDMKRSFTSTRAAR